MMYKLEKEFLEKTEDLTEETNRREIIAETELEKLKGEYPKISNEYLNYLKEIGSGSFRESQFRVQQYLFDLEDIGLEEDYELKKGIMFFGMNFSGDFSGFDFTKNPELVVEFWHEDGTIYKTKKTFKEYIRQQMLMGENGEDISE